MLKSIGNYTTYIPHSGGQITTVIAFFNDISKLF